jgi:hypothetical protein
MWVKNLQQLFGEGLIFKSEVRIFFDQVIFRKTSSTPLKWKVNILLDLISLILGIDIFKMFV